MVSYKAQQKCHTLDKFHSHSQAQKEIGLDGGKKMKTIREEAQNYEAPKTLNIADLDKFQIDVELKESKGKTSDGEEFTYKYAEIDGKEYRIAGSIIGGIKALLEKMPNLKFVSVLRSGTGMNTRYQVIPFDQQKE